MPRNADAHQELSPFEAFLLSRINALADEDGWCRLTNRELATRSGTTRKVVVRALKQLTASRCILRERDYHPETGSVVERRLRVLTEGGPWREVRR